MFNSSKWMCGDSWNWNKNPLFRRICCWRSNWFPFLLFKNWICTLHIAHFIFLFPKFPMFVTSYTWNVWIEYPYYWNMHSASLALMCTKCSCYTRQCNYQFSLAYLPLSLLTSFIVLSLSLSIAHTLSSTTVQMFQMYMIFFLSTCFRCPKRNCTLFKSTTISV